MKTPSVESGMQAHAAVLETAALAQWDFTQEKMASLLWLREWYQHGRSDRMEVVRHLEFLKFLLTHGKLPLSRLEERHWQDLTAPCIWEEEANGLRSALLISDRQQREWGETLTAG